MEREKFRMKDCDGDLSEILQPYIEDGRAQEYGALHVKNIIASRLNLRNYRGDCAPSFETPMATTFCAFKVDKVQGLWVIKGRSEEWPMQKWMQVKIDSESLPNIKPDDFIKLLESGQWFGTHAPDQDGSNSVFRGKFGFQGWPMKMGDPALKLAALKMKFHRLARSSVSILCYGAPIRAQVTVGKCHALYLVHKGQPVQWIVVPPRHREVFEHQIRRFLGILEEPACSQFVKHSNLWIHPHLLRSWGIPCYEITQQAGQLLIVFPGSYIWGFATGYSLLERKLFSHIAWKPINECFCSMKSDGCRTDEALGVPPALSEEDSNTIEYVSNQMKFKPRRKRGINNKTGHKKRKLEQREENIQSLPANQQHLAFPENIDFDPFDYDAAIPDDGFYFSDGDEGFNTLAQVMPGDSKDKEIDTLRTDIEILVADRNHVHQRKEVYKERLYHLENYVHALEGEVQRSEFNEQGIHERDEYIHGMEAILSENTDPNAWRDCAMRGFHIIGERERTIKEKDTEVEERDHIIAEQQLQIEEQEQELEASKIAGHQQWAK